jgi:hypothetical protein
MERYRRRGRQGKCTCHCQRAACGIVNEALRGTSCHTRLSELEHEIYKQTESLRQRPRVREYSYLFANDLWMKRSCSDEAKNIATDAGYLVTNACDYCVAGWRVGADACCNPTQRRGSHSLHELSNADANL